MKIRLEGTKEEISKFQAFLIESNKIAIYSISKFYPNGMFREFDSNPINTGRVYVEIEC